VSSQSTIAQISSCAVAFARAESIRLVRPDEVDPCSSVMAPRGKPNNTASISTTPCRKNLNGAPLMPLKHVAKPTGESQLNFFFCDERVHV
jgi:hypothetical protein